MILSEQTFAIPFLTRNAAGFLSDPSVLPTGSIWASGALSTVAVTITKSASSQYIASGSFPGMDAGAIATLRASYTTDIARLEPLWVDTCFDAVPAAAPTPSFSAVPFEVRNAARALVAPDSLPAGKLLVNGVDSGKTVTVALVSTGRYTATVASLPTLTSGQFLTLRLTWLVNGLAGGVDAYGDFYWVPAAATSEAVSTFDALFSTAAWPCIESFFGIPVVWISKAGVATSCVATRQEHSEGHEQAEEDLGTVRRSVYTINSYDYEITPEIGATITHSGNLWVVKSFERSGYIVDFTCQHVKSDTVGPASGIVWTPARMRGA